MYDVTALGELLIDFAAQRVDADGYPTMAAHPGGAPGNFLAAVRAYGGEAAFLGKVGADAFGQMLIATLQKAGIETRGIRADPAVFTTLAFVTFSPEGDRAFSFARKPGADTRLTYEELDLSLIDDARAFHFGTLSLTDEPMRTTTQKAVAYAKDSGKLITCDPNLRLSLWDDPAAARRQMSWALQQADVVKISDEEVDFLWGCDAKTGAERLLQDCDVSLAMVTCGAKGCYLHNQNGWGAARCPPVKVLDTTGAGDIFGGSAVRRLLRLGKHPRDLTPGELDDIAAFATAAASLSTQKSGGIPSIPPEEAVQALISR